MVKEDRRTSTMPSSSSCRPLPVALGPLEATSNFTSSAALPSPPRVRRLRRVLYPASQSRRPLPREAPDQAQRWLLLLTAVVLLQIYTEETHACPDLQSQCPDPAVCQPQEGEASLGAVQGWMREEPWRVQMVAGASETQLECVVS